MTEKELAQLISSIRPLAQTDLDAAQARLDNLTKPRGSLGKLEETAKRLAAIQQTLKPKITKKRVYTLAADHGVADDGVSLFPKEVTRQMVFNFLNGGAAINVLVRHVGAEIKVVDIGVDFNFDQAEGLIREKVGHGTRNLAVGPAMTRQEALDAIGVGVKLARDAAREGVDLLGAGEMGIANTTSAAAILAVFSGLSPEEVVGRGTGVDDEGLKRKANAVRRGIAVNAPDAKDPIDVLTKVGGYEIAGIAGLCLGGAACGAPVVVDGFISTAGALIASRLCSTVDQYLFLSHLSQENAHVKMLEQMGQKPLLSLELRLGEGTGAALAMSLIEASAKILSEMATFGEAGVSDEEIC